MSTLSECMPTAALDPESNEPSLTSDSPDNDDVTEAIEEAQPPANPCGSEAAQHRWGRVRRQIVGSLNVFHGLLGHSFADFFAQGASRRLLMTSRSPVTSARTSLDTEAAVALGAIFVPEPHGSSGTGLERGSMLLPIGSGNHQLLLVDPSMKLPRRDWRVAIEAAGEFIPGMMRLAPCLRRVCCAVGIDERARLVMYRSDAQTPWPILWKKTKQAVIFDLDIDCDGSRVACVMMGVDGVDIHDAKNGTLLTTVRFGACALPVPQMCLGHIVRFSHELLVVKGGFGSPHAKAIGVWQLDKSSKHVASAAMSQPKLLKYEYEVGPIAMCKKYLAVSALDGRIGLHKVEGGDVHDWQIRVDETREGSGQVMAMTFSHDDTMLAVAWESGDVAVYATDSTAQIAVFHQDDCSGVADMTVLAFSLDDVCLVMGGANCASVSVHQVLPLRVRKFSSSGGSNAGNNNLRSAAVSEHYVALVDEERVVVQWHNGDKVADIACGQPITSNFMIAPVALRPTDEHVTVVLSSKTVASYELQSGSHTLAWEKTAFEGFLSSVRYSPDGAFLAVVSCTSGVHIYQADSGVAVRSFTQKPDYEMVVDIRFDSTSTNLFIGSWGNTPHFVIDVSALSSGDPDASCAKVHSFDREASSKNGCGTFDDRGERIAFDLTDHTGDSRIVISLLGEANNDICVFKRAAGEDGFFPKGFNGDWLLLSEAQMDETATSEVALVHCGRNHEVPATLNALLPMVLGTGHTTHSSVGWVPKAAAPTIHATVGSSLVFVNLEQFETMISDGCFCATLLMDLCGHGTTFLPEVIMAIVARFPHCINISKRTTEGDGKVGETVLHYCAKKHLNDAVELWLPLDSGVYTPISSGEHSCDINGKKHSFRDWTALHEAIVRHNTRMVEHFVTTLTRTINGVTASLISDAFALLTLMMPHFVPRVLSLLDTRLVRKEARIETYIHTQDAAFVYGRDRLYESNSTSTEQNSGHSVVRMPSNLGPSDELEKLNQTGEHRNKSQPGVQWGTDPVSGKSILPSEHPKRRLAQVDISVVQLQHIIGYPDTAVPGRQVPLFHAIVDRCDFAVYESIIMKAAVDFKWKQTRWFVLLDLSIYVVSLLIASWATVRLAWEASNQWEQTMSLVSFPRGKAATEIIVLVMAVLELLLLVWECMQMYVLRWKWVTGFNLLDLASTFLMAATAAGYLIFSDGDWPRAAVQTLGSVGVMTKWLCFLGYLDSFQYFSKTLHMIKQIMLDIVPYMAVYAVIISALLFFNIINMPNSESFGQRGAITEGFGSSVLVAWQMGIMGDFDMSSYGNLRATLVARVVFVAFSAFGFLIILNLLIAVMGHSFEDVKAVEHRVAMWHQAQTIAEYERLLVGLGWASGWKRTDPQKFPRYMAIAQEVIHTGDGCGDIDFDEFCTVMRAMGKEYERDELRSS